MKNRSFDVPREFRQRLKRKEPLIGGWQTLAQPAIAEIMILAGIDWLLVDMEHSMLDFDDVAASLRVADLMGCTVMVRPPDHSAGTIKRVLDAKAHGIMAPNVKTAEEARAVVAATRYAPEGVRGVGLGRAQGYGTAFDEQFQWAKEGPLVVIQIEDAAALPELDEIFAVPHVDAFFVGPYDLSCSLGVAGQFDHPDFLSAMDQIARAADTAGLPSGFHQVEPDAAALQKQVDAGHSLIAYGVDFRFVFRGAADGIQAVKTNRSS